MKLYIAAGNNISNKEWALKVKHSLQELFTSINVLNYDHWKSYLELMDFDYEAKILKVKIGKEEEFGIFGKSLGVILALKTIREEKINPKFLIFLGIPINFCKENNIEVDSYLQEFSCPTLIIQNDKDPTINSKELEVYFKNKGIKNYDFVEYQSDTHNYLNLDEIKVQIKKFLKK